MSEHADEAERRQHVIRVMGLIVGGMGRCPGCHQLREIFYRRRAIASTKERCLDCWKGERERSRKRRSAVSQQAAYDEVKANNVEALARAIHFLRAGEGTP